MVVVQVCYTIMVISDQIELVDVNINQCMLTPS